MIIDFHSHLLPGIDDGSRDLSTSINMVRICAEQGVECMVLTPHFYADCDSIGQFLKKRECAYDLLKKELPDQSPMLLKGAEAAFFRGISHAERLEELTMEDTDVLLLEMPFAPWSRADIDEVRELSARPGLRLMFAHLERYLLIAENKKGIEELLALPATVQVNAGSLLDWKRRGGALKLLRSAKHCVIGSDCHGLHRRPPNLAEGREMVRKKLGEAFLHQIDEDGGRLIASDPAMYTDRRR